MKRLVKLCALLLALSLLFSGCAGQSAAPAPAESGAPAEANTAETAPEAPAGRVKTGSMELQYADQFSVDYYSDGTALITIATVEDKFLLLPEGVPVPEDLEAGVKLIRQPLDCIYQASSSAVDLYLQLGALDKLRMTSTNAANWELPEVLEALEDGTMLYAGKYSAPDFEMLLSNGCDFVMESTMIYHSPDIKEKLESLGFPVMVERSSYETHPLGRMEWIKLHGLLVGREQEAEDFFNGQLALLESMDLADTGKTVAFFHISSTGAAVVRKPGDYVSKMIEMAGGEYVFSHIDGQDENALSTMNMQMESFYAGAKDADILIYNSTIAGELDSVEQLLQQSGLLADFKAVQNGNVWCTGHNLFQKTSASAGIIADLNAIFTGRADEGAALSYLYKLN
jgi:iron complex transport system substrate-binding protein